MRLTFLVTLLVLGISALGWFPPLIPFFCAIAVLIVLFFRVSEGFISGNFDTVFRFGKRQHMVTQEMPHRLFSMLL